MKGKCALCGAEGVVLIHRGGQRVCQDARSCETQGGLPFSFQVPPGRAAQAADALDELVPGLRQLILDLRAGVPDPYTRVRRFRTRVSRVLDILAGDTGWG
jgi:hypothetical protein